MEKGIKNMKKGHKVAEHNETISFVNILGVEYNISFIGECILVRKVGVTSDEMTVKPHSSNAIEIR